MKNLIRRPCRPASAALTCALVLVASGCDRLRPRELVVPTADQAAAFYDAHSAVESVALSGNVVEVRVRQPRRQLERGGTLWAKVGPYVYLFAPSTRELLEAYNGIAAIRVITYVDGDHEVARVLMRREDMNDILWRRGQYLLGMVLDRGTEQPRRLEELIEWAEEYTTEEYNPEFVPR